ncbi:MAG TPA: hypothetical protein VMX16_18760 [Terriglobia bacterium]|nr:hypothetical protein [Terriglobia bacterium]
MAVSGSYYGSSQRVWRGSVEGAPGVTMMGEDEPVRHSPKDAPVPLRDLPRINEIDEILRSVAQGTRQEVHAAIEAILKGWPGRKRSEIWDRLRWVRNGNREAPWRHTVWNEEDIEFLRAQYAQGRAGARRAVKELLARHPDWKPRSIWYKAAQLRLLTQLGPPRLWTRDEEGKLLWDAEMKQARTIARKLKRSEAAVRQKLSSNGVKSKVRIPKDYSLHRISKLLGVSDSIVRAWFQKGLFGEPNGQGKRKVGARSGVRISSEAVETFCEEHPEKINADECDPHVLDWLEEKKRQPEAWRGLHQHLAERKSCPSCGRVIPGNGYFRHVKHCIVAPAPAEASADNLNRRTSSLPPAQTYKRRQ